MFTRGISIYNWNNSDVTLIRQYIILMYLTPLFYSNILIGTRLKTNILSLEIKWN